MHRSTHTASTPALEAENLIAAIAASRDRRAFAELFAHFAPRIKAYLRRNGASDGEAEDLAQEAMLTVWRRAHMFDRAQGAASTWIFTIARNKRIDALRRERRPEVDPDDPALVPARPDAADTTIEAAQTGDRLRAAVAELPKEQARLLHMSFFEDKSHSTIAAEVGLPLGTVKSRVRLALARLRGSLEDLR
jgi:RNA polymerase sigma-70 factor (ECF subfamily)